jgi:multidrug resistance efflux pump
MKKSRPSLLTTAVWLWALPLVLALAACGAGSPGSGSTSGRGQADGPAGSSAAGPATGGPAAGGRAVAAIPVQAVVVKAGPLSTTHSTAGSVLPVTQSPVAAQISGVVKQLLHRAGEYVQAGETVIQLDDSQLELAVQSAQAALGNARISLAIGQDTAAEATPQLSAQVEAAQAALASAQKSYDSAEALFKAGGATETQLDTAKSQLEQAQASLTAAQNALQQNQKAESQSIAQLKLAVQQAGNQLELAELNLRNAAVKAPFAGQIAAINVSPGSFVGQNTAAFVLVSGERQISFNVPPGDAPALPAGAEVQFTLAGGSYPVRISQAPSAPINGLVPLVAAAPTSVNLPYGTVGAISYPITLAEGILVPISALQTNQNQYFVYTVVGGEAVVQPVTILAETGSTAAVSGPAAGATVVVSPPPGLLAGSGVTVVGGQPGQGNGS